MCFWEKLLKRGWVSAFFVFERRLWDLLFDDLRFTLLDLLFDDLQFTIFCGLVIIVIFVIDYVVMKNI